MLSNNLLARFRVHSVSLYTMNCFAYFVPNLMISNVLFDNSPRRSHYYPIHHQYLNHLNQNDHTMSLFLPHFPESLSNHWPQISIEILLNLSNKNTNHFLHILLLSNAVESLFAEQARNSSERSEGVTDSLQ